MGSILCNCTAIGALGKLMTEETGTATRTFDASSKRHEFLYESLGTRRRVQHTNAITGNLARFNTGARPHSYLTQGTIALQPSPAELTIWLQRIFGGTLAGTDIPLTNVLRQFDVMVYRENGIFQYTDCVVSQAMIRGKSANGGEGSEFMELIVNVVGQEELILADGSWPVTEPSLGSTAAYLPYAIWETSLDINAVSADYDSYSIAIDNKLDIRNFQYQFPTCIRSTGRDITLDVVTPFTCVDLARSLAAHTADATASFAMTTTGMSTTIDFTALRNTFKTPTIGGKSAIPLEYSFEAYRTAATPEVVLTHDATP